MVVRNGQNIYDNAKDHFLSDFPSSLPIEQAYVHIGFYLGWIIESHLYSEFFEDEGAVQVFRFKRKEISCTILSEVWDGHLGQDLFNADGNMFTYYYYGGGLYQADYKQGLAEGLPSIYHVKDSWENFNKMKARIEMRFQDWKRIVNR